MGAASRRILVSVGGFKIRTEDGEDMSLAMNFRVAVTEQFADAEVKSLHMRLTYDRFVLGIKMDDKPIKETKDIDKILGDVRFLAANVEMAKDGGVADAKADLAKVPKATRDALSDMSDQILEPRELISSPLTDRRLTAEA